LSQFANASNKTCICLAYYNANSDKSYKELTNTSKLCKNYLKKYPYFLNQYLKKKLTVIFSETNNNNNNDYSEIKIFELTTML